MTISQELLFAMLIQLITAGICIGAFISTQKFLSEKFEDFKKDTKEHFDRLEHKQDKHNGLIERMAVVEQSLKSAHHRIDSALRISEK